MGERTLDKEGALMKMRGLLFGFSITRSIAVAAELGIATGSWMVHVQRPTWRANAGCLSVLFTVCSVH